MGKKDAVSKHYMSKNEIFADAVNFYFFDGKEKVKPEDLEELDSSELVLPYGKSTEQKSTKGDSVQGKSILSTPVQKYRDILKRCVIRRCQETVYMIYGIEAQSDIHYAMAGADTGCLFRFYALGWPSKPSGDAGLAGEYEEVVLE